MPSEPFFDSACADFAALGPRHVWSLVVTVFGDLAQQPGDTIDGPVLSALLIAMGVKPEAIRVALHRLRADDWIESEKAGRTSRHRLSAKGRRESRAATPLIYGRPEDTAKDWQLLILESVTDGQRPDITQAGFAPLMPRVFIGPAGAAAPGRALVLRPDRVPDWLGAQFEPKDLTQDYAALHSVLRGVSDRMPQPHGLGARQVAVLRCLIVHAWRRLVLRHPDLPRQVYSTDWKGHDCRQLVTGLLDRLPRPSLASLQAKA